MRITSPAATQSMVSPGRRSYFSAIVLGTVTWYLEVILAITLCPYTKLYPYYSKDQILFNINHYLARRCAELENAPPQGKKLMDGGF
jgi:hypothetical protein